MKGGPVRRALQWAWLVVLALVGAGAFVYVVMAEHTQQEAASAKRRAAAHAAPSAGKPAEAPNKALRHPEARPIRIGWTAWSDAEIVTRLVKRILEERMGYEVKLTMADIGIQYQGVANGDLDAMFMAWLPVTHRPYWKKFAGKVVNLGPLYTRAKLGWVVPDYVPADVLGSITDLRKADVRQRLDGRIQGIDPGSGLMQASEKAMKVYDLSDYELVSASGAAMTAALGRAIRRHQWIVVTGWSPHWMFARWHLRYLDDPKGALGGRERIHALVREGFYQDYPPEVTEMLSRIFIPLDELEAALLEANEASVDQAVDHYMTEHPDRIRYWVTGEP